MGGLPVSDDVRRIVTEEWYKLSRGGTLDVVVKDVIEKAKPRIIREKLTPPTSHTTYNNIIRELRNLPPEKKKALDNLNKSWNLDNFNLAPDTIPYVLQLWRYSINLDEVFTIRHAKWASRLCYLINKLDIAEQWIHSLRYAREEELSFLSGTPMRITHLNSLIIMSEPERFTLRETDNNFKINSRLNNNNVFVSFAQDGGIIEEYLHSFSDVHQAYLDCYVDHKMPNNFERVDELHHLIGSLPSSSKCFPSFESRMVYLRHLSSLSKLPYFKTVEPKQVLGLIVDLRKWILDYSKPKEESTELQNKKLIKPLKTNLRTRDSKPIILPESLWSNPPPFDYLSQEYIPFPLDIYLRAGFSFDEDAKDVEEELRKKYPDYFGGQK
jgi:hypothetical protein